MKIILAVYNQYLIPRNEMEELGRHIHDKHDVYILLLAVNDCCGTPLRLWNLDSLAVVAEGDSGSLGELVRELLSGYGKSKNATLP